MVWPIWEIDQHHPAHEHITSWTVVHMEMRNHTPCEHIKTLYLDDGTKVLDQCGALIMVPGWWPFCYIWTASAPRAGI